MNKTQRGPRVIADETRRATENASSPGLTYRNRFSPDCKNRGESFAPRHVATSRARLSRVTQAIVTEGEKGEGELLSYETRETIKRERERGRGIERRRGRRVPRNVVHKGVEVGYPRVCTRQSEGNVRRKGKRGKGEREKHRERGGRDKEEGTFCIGGPAIDILRG